MASWLQQASQFWPQSLQGWFLGRPQCYRQLICHTTTVGPLLIVLHTDGLDPGDELLAPPGLLLVLLLDWTSVQPTPGLHSGPSEGLTFLHSHREHNGNSITVYILIDAVQEAVLNRLDQVLSPEEVQVIPEVIVEDKAGVSFGSVD